MDEENNIGYRRGLFRLPRNDADQVRSTSTFLSILSGFTLNAMLSTKCSITYGWLSVALACMLCSLALQATVAYGLYDLVLPYLESEGMNKIDFAINTSYLLVFLGLLNIVGAVVSDSWIRYCNGTLHLASAITLSMSLTIMIIIFLVALTRFSSKYTQVRDFLASERDKYNLVD